MLALSMTGQISLIADGTSYYQDINVSSLDGTSAFDCHWFNDADNKEIRPSEVEIRSGGGIIRVTFLTDYIVNYIIQSIATNGGAGGGGGGGGITQHELLLNLNYTNAAHVGFAAGSSNGGVGTHGDADHSKSYIINTDVTYTNLDNNGDVGDGLLEVAWGRHTHELGDPYNYNDVPSGSIILFGSDTVIAGYTLLVDVDDMLVYITKGNTAGGETGNTLYTGSTWTQPNHSHDIPDSLTHMHTFTDSGHTHLVSGATNNDTSSLKDQGSGSNTNTPRHNHVVSITSQPTAASGITDPGGVHNHGGTDPYATANSWRPRGWNFTRQQKI